MAFDTKSLGDGTHRLRVVANQPNGDTADTVITVMVANRVQSTPAAAHPSREHGDAHRIRHHERRPDPERDRRHLVGHDPDHVRA